VKIEDPRLRQEKFAEQLPSEIAKEIMTQRIIKDSEILKRLLDYTRYHKIAFKRQVGVNMLASQEDDDIDNEIEGLCNNVKNI